MENINAYVSETVKLTLEITQDGVGVTYQAPTATIKRMSDNKYWTGAVWQTGVSTPVMSEYDSAHFPGLYTYDLALIATAEVYLIAYTNTGSYALNEFVKLTSRLKPFNEVAVTRTGTAPASSTYGEKLEEVYGGVVGKIQYANDGTGARIKASISNYAESAVIKEMDITKPNAAVNTQTLDTNAMAGRKAST